MTKIERSKYAEFLFVYRHYKQLFKDCISNNHHLDFPAHAIAVQATYDDVSNTIHYFHGAEPRSDYIYWLFPVCSKCKFVFTRMFAVEERYPNTIKAIENFFSDKRSLPCLKKLSST